MQNTVTPPTLLHPECISHAKGPRLKARLNNRIPDEHSTLVPPLPIPNRAVKRCCADDSMDYPCESRSSSGPQKQKAQPEMVGLFALCARQGAPIWRWKSSTRPTRGRVSRTARVSLATANLKE